MADTKYCYPDSDVLKNKPGIRDPHVLLALETECASLRLLELQMHPVKGRFDFKHLCRIHGRIFQDLYSWAGKPRTVDIAKGNLFCLVQNISSYAEDIFSRYYPECKAAGSDPDLFIKTFAKHYADLNALHPFREGNGRAQREFARQLVLECGYLFDLRPVSHSEMLQASVESFDGDNSGLERIFAGTLKKL